MNAFEWCPEWPKDESRREFVVPLASNFRITPYPNPAIEDEAEKQPFIKPTLQFFKLKMLLSPDNRGGSILVTGYRGTGKTSLVHKVLAEIAREKSTPPENAASDTTEKNRKECSVEQPEYKWYSRIFGSRKHQSNLLRGDSCSSGGMNIDSLNEAKDLYAEPNRVMVIHLALSSSLDSLDLIQLMLEQLKIKWEEHLLPLRSSEDREREMIEIENSTFEDGENTGQRKAENTITEKLEKRQKAEEDRKLLGRIEEAIRYTKREFRVDSTPSVDLYFGDRETQEHGRSVERRKLADAQNRFCDIVADVSARLRETGEPGILVFVFDELDKLIPNIEPESNNNKSSPTDDYARRLADLQRLVSDLKFLLSESECFQIFIAGKDVDDNWLEDQNKGEGLFESVFGQNVYVPTLLSTELDSDATDKARELANDLGIPVQSWSFNTLALLYPLFAGSTKNTWIPPVNQSGELATNRAVMTRCFLAFIRYLTYKGRGMPRKIQRELYSWTEPDGNGGHQITIPLRALRKMGFYADIVEHLEQHYDDFSWLEDRAKVATFHIIDYILKFYDTGFTKRDIEHANFMRFRPELYPSPSLVSLVLRVFEGKLFRRMHRRGTECRLLPAVIQSLRYFSLAFSQEQMELRNTDADHQSEMKVLENTLDEVKESVPVQRLLSSQAQFRMGEICEHLGHFFDARLAYAKALRWVRQDLAEVLGAKSGAKKISPLRHQDIQSLVGMAIQIYHRLGRLRERLGEFREAAVQYHEAEHLFHAYHDHCVYRNIATGKHQRETIAPDASLHEIPGLENPEKVSELTGLNRVDDLAALTTEDQKRIRNDHKLDDPKIITNWSDLAKKALGAPVVMLPHSLFEALEGGHNFVYGGKQNFRHGLVPMQAAWDPEQHRATLNYLALAYEKMNERTAANRYLLLALAYMQETHDEYGEIEQLLILGQMQAKRRDIRAAAIAYFEALRLADQLSDQPFKKQGSKIGKNYQTQPLETAIRARILTYLGDLYFASGGQLEPFEGDSPNTRTDSIEQRHEKSWSYLRGQLDEASASRVYEDRVHEVFYTHARYYFRGSGDDISHLDVQLRCLSVRMSNFRVACEDLSHCPADDTDLAEYLRCEIYTQFAGFWRGAAKLFNELGRIDIQKARQVGAIAGACMERNRLGSALKLTGQFYLLVADPRISGMRKHGLPLLQNPQTLERSEVLRVFTKRGQFAGLSGRGDPEAEKEFRGRIADRSPSWVDLTSAQERIKFVQDYITECGILESNGDGLPINSFNDSNEDQVGFDIDCLQKAEQSLLTSYNFFRESAPSIDTAVSALSAGRLYVIAAAEAIRQYSEQNDPTKNTERDAAKRLFCSSYLFAKRFLVYANDILSRESHIERSLRYLHAETHFAFVDLLLLRLVTIEDIQGELPLEGRMRAPKIEQLHENLKVIDDNEGVGLSGQIVEHFRKALSAVSQEVEDFTDRYPTPAETFFTNRHLIDPVSHFQVAQSIRARHVFWRFSPTHENPTENLVSRRQDIHNTIERITVAAEAPLPLNKSKWSEWLSDLARIHELAAPLYYSAPVCKVEIGTENEGVFLRLFPETEASPFLLFA